MDNKPITASRSRRLLNGFGLFMGGFLLASSLSYWLHVHEKWDIQKMGLTEVSYNLLGLVDVKDGKFGVIEGMQDNVKQVMGIMDNSAFAGPTSNRFAYVVNTTTNEIVWSASQLDKPYREVRFALSKGKSDFKPRYEQVHPLPPKDATQLEKDPSLKQWYEQEFLLAVLDFVDQAGANGFQFIVGEPVR